MGTFLRRLFSQPHQPFFLLGSLNAVVLMLLFIPAMRGLLAVDVMRLHGYGMIFLVFTNFFYGFSYTTFPRFSAQPPIESRRWMRVWLLNFLAALSFYVSLLLPEAFYAAAVLTALSFAYTLRIFLPIYAQAPEPRQDQYWIIVAYGMGALSNLLYLLAAVPCASCRSGVFHAYAVEIGIWLYLLFLPMLVAFRMVPFFSRVQGYVRGRGFYRVFILLLLSHVIVSQVVPKGLFAVDLAAALWLTRELLRMDLPFPNPDPLLWGLHLAMFWLPLGFFVGAVAEFFDAWFGVGSLHLPLHLLALGFVTTIFIAFATRVTLGHGGVPMYIDRMGKAIFLLTQAVVLGRIVLSLAAMSGHLFPWFDIAASLWILLFVSWLMLYSKILIQGPGHL